MLARSVGLFSLLISAVACSDGPTFEYDSQPIELQRAPTAPGGPSLGAALAKVRLGAETPLMLVDTGSMLSSLSRGTCPAIASEPGTYTGNIELLAAGDLRAPLRASFRSVTLFDMCPGAVGDANTQAVGVLGGDILRHFSLAFTQAAAMRIYSHLPASDSDLAANGYSVIKFSLRGATAVTTASRSARPALPASRVVLQVCGAPSAFTPDGPEQTCKTGEVELRASGKNLLLALSTGHGPLVLSASAWLRLGGQVPAPLGEGEPPLYSPFSTDPIPAHWVTVSRLALVDSDSGDVWPGACAELARVRRIEWTLAHQGQGTCFQACDVSNGAALRTAAYLELGSDLPAAVISDTSTIVSNLNQDFPSGAQVDGLIGMQALSGVHFEIDYASQSQGRLVMGCESGADRQSCWTAPRCLEPSKADKNHLCFGLQPQGLAPVCPK